MAKRPAAKSTFDVVAATMLLDNLIEVETAARDRGDKPGSVLPELLAQVRAFCVHKADDFDQFDFAAFMGVVRPAVSI